MRSISLSRLQDIMSISARETKLVLRQSRRKQALTGEIVTFSVSSDDVLDGPAWLEKFRYKFMQMQRCERDSHTYTVARAGRYWLNCGKTRHAGTATKRRLAMP